MTHIETVSQNNRKGISHSDRRNREISTLKSAKSQIRDLDQGSNWELNVITVGVKQTHWHALDICIATLGITNLRTEIRSWDAKFPGQIWKFRPSLKFENLNKVGTQNLSRRQKRVESHYETLIMRLRTCLVLQVAQRSQIKIQNLRWLKYLRISEQERAQINLSAYFLTPLCNLA